MTVKMRRIRHFLVLLPVILLTACVGFFNGEDQNLTAQERFPITVEPDMVTLEIAAEPGHRRTNSAQRAQLKALAAEYQYRGHGVIKVAAPNGAVNTASASALAKNIVANLTASGVQAAQVKRTTYVPSSGSAAAPVMISFTRYVASVSKCGLWDDSMSNNPRNTPNRNFGCATQNNLAAMLDDPYDLVAPRGMGPASADRRSTILKSYREGETTGAKRSQSESGTVSKVKDN